MAILVSSALVGVSLAVLVHGLVRWLTRPSGWAERYLEIPAPVARQLGRAGQFAVVAAAATILPVYLLDNGLIAPEGRTVQAPALGRFLILAFELSAWGTWVWLLRGRSALCAGARSSRRIVPAASRRGRRRRGFRNRPMGDLRHRGCTPASSGSAGGAGSPRR